MEKGNEMKIVVPTLRFSEFQGMDGWEKIRIKDFGEVITGNTPSKNEETYWNGDFVWITAQDFSGKYIYDSISKLTQFGKDKSKIIPPNSVLVTCIASIGLNAINKIECSTNQQINSICCNQKYYNEYVYYTITYNINRLKQLAGQTAVPIITKKIFEDFEIYAIKNYDEQQKIADCFSSLDELIEATAQKVEALKEYKKGLMQRLFPAEGKNVPDSRFPEFSLDVTWDIVSFSKYIKLLRGSSPRPIKEYITDNVEGINWIKIGDTQYAKGFILSEVQEKITKGGADKSRYVYKGELILANSMSFGKTYQLAIDGCIYDGWFVLREYEETYYKPFLLQLLNSDYMQNQYKRLSAGGIVLNISSEIVYQTHIFYTSKKEQQKIAECLSSLDELIEATSRKVEILKEHKKGLMQQLFPKI